MVVHDDLSAVGLRPRVARYAATGTATGKVTAARQRPAAASSRWHGARAAAAADSGRTTHRGRHSATTAATGHCDRRTGHRSAATGHRAAAGEQSSPQLLRGGPLQLLIARQVGVGLPCHFLPPLGDAAGVDPIP